MVCQSVCYSGPCDASARVCIHLLNWHHRNRIITDTSIFSPISLTCDPWISLYLRLSEGIQGSRVRPFRSKIMVSNFYWRITFAILDVCHVPSSRPGLTWWRHQMTHFPRYWPFVRAIHRSPLSSPHKGQWRGALMFSLICVWINGWVNNRKAGDLRRPLWRHCNDKLSWKLGYRLVIA